MRSQRQKEKEMAAALAEEASAAEDLAAQGEAASLKDHARPCLQDCAEKTLDKSR